MDIAEALRRLRLKHDYTQEKLGDVLGVEYSTYGKYEKGTSKLRLDQAKLIADFYKLSLDELINYGLEGEKKESKGSAKNENVIEDGIELYLKKKKLKSVSLTVELDGTAETVNHYLQLIQDINKVVAASL